MRRPRESLFRLLRGVLATAAFGALIAPAHADCPPPPPDTQQLAAALQAPTRDRGLLWRIEKDGRSSWLYGTIHVNRLAWAVPGPAVRRALDASDVLALELDIGDPAVADVLKDPDPARQARVLAGHEAGLRAAAERACAPLAALGAMRPLMQVLTLAMLESRRDGLHPELAIDAVLWGLARARDKPVIGLERPAEQAAALQPETEDDERVLLGQGLQELADGASNALARRLMDAWADGDEAVLERYPQWCECLRTPPERRFFDRLLAGRNPRLADRIAQAHAAGSSVFAGVGALHMIGPRGLPTLLRERGFTVRRVPFSPRDSGS